MQAPRIFNQNIEILRGFAALIVLISHIIFHNNYFNPTYFPISGLQGFDSPAHFAVLIFFLLSGYVIGINHKEPLVVSSIVLYLKKRFVRIYPIYLVAIILTLCVATNKIPVPIVFSNLTLTQNIAYPVIWENNPAWSLNYEALFYLLFIPISYFKIKPALAFFFFLIIGIFNTYFPVSQIVSAYCFGYCFWLAGLYVAWNLNGPVKQRHLSPMLFYILGIGYTLPYRGYIILLLERFRSPIMLNGKFWSQIIVNANDLLLLPYCFFCVLFFAGRDLKYKRIFFLFLQFLPIYLLYVYVKNGNFETRFYLGIIFYAISIIALFIKSDEWVIKKIGMWLGNISYGIYIIHFPLLILFGQLSFLGNGPFSYAAKVILYISSTFLISWTLEKKLQPKIKRLFFRRLDLKISK
ncbi:acyltransferase [Mucilaginibacter sp.]|jgi:peptidoglycan/LPS O-acetylase OafA/YrhL|uniref:acyltransferase family protein n=1 Tax=Mucilaginibacter sp. TaxID=1882438 RepID=UPI002B71BA47|nr:acyltransferase [Mucilaginibacter sp.]HTI58425.1 acyltransferase [Mucilaginibacter sp.]